MSTYLKITQCLELHTMITLNILSNDTIYPQTFDYHYIDL